ncbi:MAG: DMT family transporter [Thiohalomonadaceae bacterium]
MYVPAAYLGVILIWSTTPLAIKWSAMDAGFIFGVTARMVIGAVLCFVMLRLLRVEFPWGREAVRAYAAAALGVFGSMMCTYWGAQFIPSGFISVLFGLTPFATGVMATLWLGDPFPSPARLAGIGLGMLGLCFVFGAGLRLEGQAWLGVAAVLTASLLHSASAVGIKRAGAQLHPVALNAGALSIAVPLYVLTWLAFERQWPAELSARALGAIAYLGVLGTALGFVLYFYVLKHLSAGVIALITLISPVLALLIGSWLNDEAVGAMVWAGTACIVAGLLLYQFGGRRLRLRHWQFPAGRRKSASAGGKVMQE